MLFVKQKGKKKKYASTKALPPDASSLSLHIQRVNYVTLPSVQCLNPHYTPPPATDYGWENLNNCLVPIWSQGPPIPDIDESASVENPTPSNNDNEQNDHGDADGSENEDDHKSDDDDESDYPESDEDCRESEEEN